MKKAIRIGLSLLAILVIAGAGTYVWATMRTSSLLARTIETHRIDFAIPYPLTPSEAATLSSGQDVEAVALSRGIERGRHLIEARYVCTECHGTDFGGGVMIDDALLGRMLGPNLTTGAGSRTLTYEASDWDRAVRHGVKPGGAPSIMPSEDFVRMSDQELADVVTYIRSLPPVDGDVPGLRFGPLGKVLAASGSFRFAADIMPSHDGAHSVLPPTAIVSAEFGGHIAAVCVGCHGQTFAGGPIVGGDPTWPPAANLTPHVDGLAGWQISDFKRVVQEGIRPNGVSLLPPMDLIVGIGQNMSEVEIEALWMYLQSLPPLPTPQ